jgi:hypothetical protein
LREKQEQIFNYAILWELQSRIYLRQRASTLFRTPAEGNHTVVPNDLIPHNAWNAELKVQNTNNRISRVLATAAHAGGRTAIGMGGATSRT